MQANAFSSVSTALAALPTAAALFLAAAFGAAPAQAQSANSEPAFPSTAPTTLSVAENSTAGTVVGTVAADDADGDALTYSLDATSAAVFDIDSAGRITVESGATLNHEGTSSFSATVSVSDGKDSAGNPDSNAVDDTHTLTITVTDQDEPPDAPGAPTVSAASSSSLSVTWTAPANTGPPITDYDWRWKLQSATSWTEKTDTTTTTTSATIGELMAGTTYDVQVRATSDEGTSGWSPSGSGATNVQANRAPVFAGAPLTRSVAENSGVGTNVGAAVTATDADGHALTYSLGGADGPSFTIGMVTGQIAVGAGTTLNFEATKNSYAVTVIASDGSLSSSADVTINVTDVNEAPAFAVATFTRSVAENSAAGTKVGAVVTATDPDDGDTLTYSLGGADASSFAIDASSGQITVGSGTTLNFEAKSSYAVTVTASDTALSDTVAVTIDVTDVNEAPAFADATFTRSVAENSAAGTEVGAAVTATDPDGDTLTYSLGGTDASSFAIDDSSGQITVGAGTALNFEATKNSYAVTVTASVQGSPSVSVSAAVTIDVTDADEPPDAPLAPAVNPVTETSDSLSVTWTAPSAAGRPAIDDYDVRWFKGNTDPGNDSQWTTHDHSGTGTSTTIPRLDAGSAYRVQVRAGNDEGDGGWSASGTGSTFANANPSFPANTPTELAVAENNGARAAVGTVAAVDPDGDGLTYSLDGSSDAVFDIDDNGAITVTAANALNHEGTQSYAVTVSVRDGKDTDGAADATVDATHDLTITVDDVDEPPDAPGAPTVTGESGNLSVAWTAPNVAGRPAIDGYDVRWFQGSADPATDSEWTAHSHSGTSTTTTITGLFRGAAYRVQVRATNDEGGGDWSASGAASTIAPPAPAVSSVALVSTPTRDTDRDGTGETYVQGDAVRARVTFDAAVDVVGDPVLKLRLARSSGARDMAFDATRDRTNTTTLDFTYTIAAGDRSSGIALPANELSAPSGVTVRAENSSADANLDHTAVDHDSAHQVNGVGPALVTSFPIRILPATDPDNNIVAGPAPIGSRLNVEAFFPEEVTVSGRPRIALTVGRETRYAVYHDRDVIDFPGTGVQTVLQFGYTVAEGDADPDGVAAPANALELNGGKIANLLGNGATPAQLAHGRVPSTTGVDGVRPTVATATVNGATLTVAFNEPLGAAASLATGAFTVKKTPQNGSEETVSLSGSPAISGNTVTLTLAADAVSTDGGVKVTYTRPSSGSGNRIVDAAGNEARSFTDQQVGNVTGSTNTAPSFAPTTETSFEVEENNDAGAAVGTVAATDPDGDTLTYSLDRASDAVFDIDSGGAITVTAANALDFEARKSYAVTVSVSDGKDSDGGGDPAIDATITATVSVTNVVEPPPAPSTPTVSAAPAVSLEVTWTAPRENGSPPNTGYEVRYFKGAADPADADWSEHDHAGTGTTTTIAGLDAESEYRVQVRAVNADGTSDWSASGIGTTGLAPTVPSFDDASARLSVAENSDGGTPVGTVPATDADGDTLTYVLTSSGTDHDSFDIDGNGAITVAPGATLDFEAQPTYSIDAQVTDGEDGDGNLETTAAIDDTIAVTIDVTDEEEPPEAPRAPTVNAVSESPDSLTVTWAAPDVTGRPPVTGYGVRYKQSSESAWTSHPHGDTSTTTTIAGLEVDTGYDVQVQAVNDDGASDWSASGSGTTGAANASASFPANVPMSFSVAENSSGGTPVGTVAATDPDPGDTLSYVLDRASDAVFDIDSRGAITVAAGAALDHERTASHSITVSVHDGKDSDGQDEVTPTVDAAIVVTVDVTDVDEPPPAPAAPTVSAASATGLTVTWTAPDVTGRPPVTGYGVRYKQSSENAWTSHAHTGADTTTTIAGLEAGTGHDVQVQAINDEGASGWSASGSATTAAATAIAPSAPAAPRVSAASATSLAVSWSAPGDLGSASSISDYDLRYHAGAADPAAEADWIEEGEIGGPPDPGSSASATIGGLEPGTAYRVQVRAFGAVESGWSASGSATTAAAMAIAPSAPAAPRVSAASATSLAVSWSAPGDLGSASSISDYDLRYHAGAADPAAEADWIEEGEIGGPPDPGSSVSATIGGLEPGTAYRVQVRAFGAVESDWSASGSATTAAAPGNRDLAPSFATVLPRGLTLVRGEAMEPQVLPAATGGNGALAYGLTSDPAGLAGLDFDASLRTLSGRPRQVGSYVFTYRAEDADENRADSDAAILTFAVTVNEPPAPARREVVERTLAAVGLRTLASAVDNIGTRFASAAPAPAMTLAGRSLPLTVPGATPAARSPGGGGAEVAQPQTIGADAALGESAVAVPLAGAATDPERTQLALWARGDLGVFEGRPEPGSWYEGETLTGWLGVDARSGPLVGGLALSHGYSTARYRFAGDEDYEQGRLDLTLTALYPYGRYTWGGLELRAILGGGLGEARDRLGENPAATSPVSMLMGTLGVRHPLPFVAGIDLAARADVGVTRIETADGPHPIHGLRAERLRARLGLEASRRFALGDAAGLVPFVEAVGRQDIGADLSETGLEVAGGVRFTLPWLHVGARGRMLAVHSEQFMREHGLSVTVRLSSEPDGSGLSLALTPRWGVAAGDAEALWGEVVPRLAADGSAGAAALDARIGYGVVLSAEAALLTPFAEAEIAGQRRRLKVGTRFEATGTDLTAELSGERRESAMEEPEHGVELNLRLRF